MIPIFEYIILYLPILKVVVEISKAKSFEIENYGDQNYF